MIPLFRVGDRSPPPKRPPAEKPCGSGPLLKLQRVTCGGPALPQGIPKGVAHGPVIFSRSSMEKISFPSSSETGRWSNSTLKAFRKRRGSRRAKAADLSDDLSRIDWEKLLQ
jgi:hypothetical protein